MDLNKIYELAKMADNLPPFTNDGMFPPSKYYRFLYQLAVYKKPELSVELGVCGGGGSFNLVNAQSGQVVGIDNANEYPSHITFLEQHSNYTFWRGDSVELALDVYNQFGEVDILFIDTIHEKTRTINEFEAWYPYLAKDAIVLLDDLYRDGMQEAWDYIIRNYAYGVRLDHLHQGGSPTDGGFGVVYNIKERK